MAENTTEGAAAGAAGAVESTERGTSFLFWTLAVVIVINLVMVIGALAIFGP